MTDTYKPDMMIYHANCADGFGAAWAAWMKWGDTVEYVPCSYGQEPPEVLGKRRARFHQWLTDEGRTILTRQIGRVEGIMEMCKDIEHFKQVARKQKTITVAPYLFDDMNRIID